nr:MAG TPA: hypothetical protein [Bacteriophage sp.]
MRANSKTDFSEALFMGSERFALLPVGSGRFA